MEESDKAGIQGLAAFVRTLCLSAADKDGAHTYVECRVSRTVRVGRCP